MATNEIGEKIYYNDLLVKVTNLRVTCNDISVPICKIDGVNICPRIEAFCFSVSFFIASLYSYLFYQTIPSGVKYVFVAGLILITGSSAAWIYQVYKNYVKLELSVGRQKIVIYRAKMSKWMYLCTVAASIEESLSDERKYRKMKDSGELSGGEEIETSVHNSTETMRLKLILDEYNGIRMKIKEQYQRKLGRQSATA